MRLEGRTEISAARERVWAAVTDPRQVADCVPGAPDVEIVDARHARARIPVGGGFFKTTAVIDIVFDDLQAPAHATATGSGGAMGGSASVNTVLDLAELGPTSTALSWVAEITLGGMLGGFAGMVEGPARNGIDQTLGCLKAKLEAAEAAAKS